LWPVLKSLPEQNHPDLIVGFNQADDSGVVRLSDDTALILTVDFFPAVVDDPYVFGQVAAANALSDIYAMGGTPLCALNIVGFPSHELPIEILGDVLRGGADKINEAGAFIVGGHTMRDSELKYGLAVTGTVHPDGIFEISGAKPGDRLVLTKPLGSGIYSTALKNGALPDDDVRILYDTMSALNAAACREMSAAKANACTDVTGFGLLGHALEMAQASDVTLRIELERLPLLPGALDYARQGFLTGGGMSNREFAGHEVRVEGELSNPMEMLLYDPQTSGGLLVSVPRGSAESYTAALKKSGVESAAVIGEVLEAGKKRLELAAD
jgi:selenide,water dikinase